MNIVTMLSQAHIPVSSPWDMELLGMQDPIEQDRCPSAPESSLWQGPKNQVSLLPRHRWPSFPPLQDVLQWRGTY
ncbi:hypothetical protein NPIL_631571 [Nephila pilipes]|uniref:Uncharacterized protein n=1 Tax=Nephila pilipes TaxID=299642 RepID=A0A8X6QCJ8_NEPPI|nr:hypothetical protein NPIL_631571 [Nephila pilipes]